MRPESPPLADPGLGNTATIGISEKRHAAPGPSELPDGMAGGDDDDLLDKPDSAA
jgi:hypothetical protein